MRSPARRKRSCSCGVRGFSRCPRAWRRAPQIVLQEMIPRCRTAATRRLHPPPPGSARSPPPPPILQVKLVPSKDAPRRGKGGSLASRHAMLHSLVRGPPAPPPPLRGCVVSCLGHFLFQSMHLPHTTHHPPAPSPQVHIESMAVDLAWDIIARFGGDPSYRLPRAFFDDFVAVSLVDGHRRGCG